MKKIFFMLTSIFIAALFFSCQTKKPQLPFDEEPGTDTNAVISETIDDPVVSQDEIKQDEFIPIVSQDIQPKVSVDNEFIPLEDDSLIIELTPKKEEAPRISKPILRPRSMNETTSTAKLWNPDDKDSVTEPVKETAEAVPESAGTNAETTENEKSELVQPTEQKEQQQPTVLQEAAAPQQPIVPQKAAAPQQPTTDQLPGQTQPVQNVQTSVITEQNSAISTQTQTIELPAVSDFLPSRTVEVKNNQYIEVTYPGSGWVYIGEDGATSLLNYFGRKTDNGNTIFTLRSKESGTTLLHFYKIDALSGNYIDDYLEVVVLNESASQQERYQVPLYEMTNALTPPSASIQKDESIPQSTIPRQDPAWTSSVSTEPDVQILFPTESDSSVLYKGLSPLQLLEQAKAAYNNAEYKKALDILDEFLINSVSNLDEAWYLKGQIYETPSDQRNIRKALEAYTVLTKAYPSSPLWKGAKDRITYLEKFYFSIQ